MTDEPSSDIIADTDTKTEVHTESTPVFALPARTAFLMLVGGIILPLVALVFEANTGLSRNVFFDPMPTWTHYLLIACVPLANTVMLTALLRGWTLSPRWMLFHAFATGIAFFYTILFIPLTPLAPFALVFYGLGFLILAPLISLLGLLRGRAALQRRVQAEELPPLPSRWAGIALAIAALIAADLPATLTRAGMNMTTSDSASRRLNGIRFLRLLGNEKIMLKLCYPATGLPTDLAGILIHGSEPLSTDHARTVFYRVTGVPFNRLPQPARHTLRDWENAFDNDVGGDIVGGRASGVSLASSRMDGSVDAGAALSYLEWTMVLRNTSPTNQEARGEILLPPGAVVSRLTLWVNGEEREAAFGGRGEVRQAYQSVVRTNRDPVLVTTAGKDRVLVQLFPIPGNGGEMKVRIGITAPMALPDLRTAQLQLPSFSERNFEIGPSMRHAVWLESSTALQGGAGLQQEKPRADVFALRGNLAEPGPAQRAALVQAARSPASMEAWSTDTKADDGNIIVQQIRMQVSPPPGRVALVIDASLSMRELKPQLLAFVASLPLNVEAALVVAGDAAPDVFPHNPLDAAQTRTYLDDFRFVGGSDNSEALSSAWAWASQRENGAIVWVHGPQPAIMPSLEPLLQRFERHPFRVKLFDLPAVPGPDLIGKKLDGLGTVTSVARSGTIGEDLARLFAQWRPGAAIPVLVRERRKPSPLPPAAKTSEHLARLWAADRVAALSADGKLGQHQQALKTALRYQLVTPLSGAVVLETSAQYKQAGLEPVEPGSVPTIPEPETWLMMIVALLIMAWRYRRPRLLPPGAAAA